MPASAAVAGTRYGTRYDLTQACPACGSGARQIGPAQLRAGDVPRAGEKTFQTYEREAFVSARVATALRASGPQGLELREAAAPGSGQPLSWFQLLPEHELPKMDPATRRIVRQHPCPSCDRGDYHLDAEWPEFVYDAGNLGVETLPDLAHTYERFGNSWLGVPFEESALAQPLLVAKPSVHEATAALKISSLRFEPICLLSPELHDRRQELRARLRSPRVEAPPARTLVGRSPSSRDGEHRATRAFTLAR